MRTIFTRMLFVLLSMLLAGCTSVHKQPCLPAYCQHVPRLLCDLRRDGVVMIRQGDQVLFLLPTDHFFTIKGAELLPEREKSINHLATLLKSYGKTQVHIYGFTDEVDSAVRNRALSHMQAQTIAAHLWDRGVRFDRLEVRGFGERPTIASNGYPLGSLKNRRIEISLIDRGVCFR